VAAALTADFRLWCKRTTNHRAKVLAIGGKAWMLDEVSIVSLYHRAERWCNDQVSSVHRGLWTKANGMKVPPTTIGYANERLVAPVTWRLNRDSGVIPPVG
jgi:hypothetical protein